MKLPPRAPFPGVGTLEPPIVALAGKQMANVDLSESDMPINDRGMREAAARAIGEIADWLAAARVMRGGGLVCFYY